MAWTSSQVTQNGNTTVNWTLGPHGSISSHDAIVLKPTSGSSGMRIESTTVRIGPSRYQVAVRVVGGGAMAFRFAAEQMD
jgi:hypothetical protein